MVPTNWNKAAFELSQQGRAYVLVTLVGVSGSTPRNSGTKMVISKDDIFDTIGGGHLEHKSIKHAHKMLAAGKSCQHLEHFQLGTNLGQCCGGNASVMFECFASVGVNIMVFGAGHVGKALVAILAGLPCQVTWVDSRAEQFPADVENYHNVTKVISEEPEFEVASMPENSYFVVMTHNHQMDFEISQAILKRGDFHYLGLIASGTKWRRFQQRYKHREIDPNQVARMSCPIGLEQVGGKLPMEVAVSVSGEIINLYQAEQKVAEQGAAEQKKAIDAIDSQTQTPELAKMAKARPTSQQGIYWKEFKELLNTD
ncbi:xanthine dehydrogenase accessory protein XdhC [Shewanella eurypsychrophilus]|uniref:Xanthine dehydrogenase accessory protein XdhC n=2 Tax=Shewanella TaxID=22 RepID=A0ABX6VCM1_9GAMM|nr:xanthine dehydrogenase accessory protein XdhC [Shewanella eurypsychrophilus]QFU25295.1 xanthine dehydrogenase accessory protein XdhC [Shewanella sp. YLB-09]QPG60442.1 xanthine dehydrogenase accessory protein XdhC [Shewanella eurypsychrophilus]